MEELSVQKKHWPAWAAHLSILIPGVGFIVPLGFWFWLRNGEADSRFQILQAFVFQMLQVVFWQVVLLAECILLVLYQIINSLLRVSIVTQQTNLKFALMVLGVIFVGLNLGYILLGVGAAIRINMGKPWFYPWVGKKIFQGLFINGSIDQDFEIRLVAAMNHFGIFYGISGILVPLLTWIIVKGHNIKLNFHAVQALVIQAFAQFFLHGMLILNGVVSFPIVVFVTMLNRQGTEIFLNQTMIIALVVIMGIILCLIVLLHPLLAVFATIAGVRLLRNKEYTYPIIGKKIKKRIVGAAA